MVEELTPTKSTSESRRATSASSTRDRPHSTSRATSPARSTSRWAISPPRSPTSEWDDTDVVCACPVGQSSKQAAMLISSYEGVEEDVLVASMAGGYEEWDFELETGAPADA